MGRKNKKISRRRRNIYAHSLQNKAFTQQVIPGDRQGEGDRGRQERHRIMYDDVSEYYKSSHKSII